MRSLLRVLSLVSGAVLVAACAGSADTSSASSSAEASSAAPSPGGQAAVADSQSVPNVVRIAAGSADHTTLVKALEAAGLVDALANPGPFTVFAPVNAAFDKLPAGALDDLLKPENKSKLKAVLYHHVITSSRTLDDFTDGEVLGMVDGTSATFRTSADGAFIGEARIVASVPASNGVVHVIDGVLLPK